MAAARSKAMDSLRRLNAVAAASVPSGASFCSLYSAVACPMSTMAAGVSSTSVGGVPLGDAPGAKPSLAEELRSLPDEEVVKRLSAGEFPHHKLEMLLADATRAVRVRRKHLEVTLGAGPLGEGAAASLSALPVDRFNEDVFYQSIEGTNCENVIGYIPYPVGTIGPLTLDGKEFHVPMATTEGALLASANRGARAIALAGGATTELHDDGMTRAPLIKMPTAAAAAALKAWVETPENFTTLETAFNSTTRFGKLKSISCTVAGRNVFVRFRCFTGDAMGMNMITKGVSEALVALQSEFPAMRLLALSGNFCTDKKPSAVNWVNGRGKSVTAEVHLSADILAKVLKTNADALVELNVAKNLIGSAMAGSVGGFNAHASNIVTAVYLATGQDPAQNVESSNCITLFEKDQSGDGVYASVTMPSVEVGTVGGGTSLPAQGAALSIMGVKGASRDVPGANSQQLARIVAGATLAGELSLMAALTSGDLLSAHIKLNRKTDSAPGVGADVPASSPAGVAAFSTSTGGPSSPRRTRTPSVHPHAGPGGGVGAFKVPTAAVAPGRRFFAAPVAAHAELDFDGSETPRLTVP